MFWRVTLATDWRLVSVAKSASFAFQRQFLKFFHFFPQIFVTVHCLPHFSLSNTPCLTSKTIHFCIISSPILKKRYGFSLSHFIFHVLSVLFLILWVCCCHYALKNIMLDQGFALSWWVFFDWELVFLTLLLLFIWSLCSVLCFMNVLFHSYHVCGILSHYLSFESLWCSMPTWFWVITVHHHIRLPIPLIMSVLFMISWF